MRRMSWVIAACGAAAIAGSAQGQWWWPPTEGVGYLPQCPHPNSVIEVLMAGDWPHNCVPNRIDFTRNGNVIDVLIERDPPPGFCLTVITPWSLRIEIGTLPTGEYELWVTYLEAGRPQLPRTRVNTIRVDPSCAGCYPDCDTSTGPGVLDIFDFLCFGNRFAANDPYACDCDTSTGPGVCDIFDFLCFGNAFSKGCP